MNSFMCQDCPENCSCAHFHSCWYLLFRQIYLLLWYISLHFCFCLPSINCHSIFSTFLMCVYVWLCVCCQCAVFAIIRPCSVRCITLCGGFESLLLLFPVSQFFKVSLFTKRPEYMLKITVKETLVYSDISEYFVACVDERFCQLEFLVVVVADFDVQLCACACVSVLVCFNALYLYCKECPSFFIIRTNYSQ